MLSNFQGISYAIANDWFDMIDVNKYKDTPIKYLEIGTFYGGSVISVAKTYGSHSDSKLYCIDPWDDYNEYPEYKNQQPTIFKTFMSNIVNSDEAHKIIIKRGYSNIEIPNLEDNFFDIIYIDGNHEPEYVLEDAVLAFRKLKVDGIMIFDDYNNHTKNGIDGFLNGYHKRFQFLGIKGIQVFIKKLR